MTPTLQDTWQRCMETIRGNVNEQQFTTWFTPLKLKSYDADAHVLCVYMPSSFYYEYIEEHFRRLFHLAIYRHFGKDTQLEFEVEVAGEAKVSMSGEANLAPVQQAKPRQQANEAPDMMQAVTPVQEWDSQLNGQLSFQNFIEGNSNRLPRNVGQTIAENPTQQTFNPLFIYGPSGVGKTHLLNAIGLRVKERHPEMRVLYLSAHLFQVQYTDAVRKNKFNDFMFFYQSIDVLIVDDIQEMAGKEGTEYAFFHIFNHLRQLGKQIIIASDRPPMELRGMQERLITRFSSGLIAEVERPEEELRRHILENRIKADGLQIPAEVLDYVSHNICESVRELEGAINSLLAYSVVYNKEVDLEFTQRIMQQNVRRERKVITLDNIIDCICEYYKVRVEDIYGKSRKANIARARHMCIYLAQQNIQMTASKIGAMIGDRDHATVLHSIKTIRQQLDVDKQVQQDVQTLQKMLKEV